MTTGLTTTDTHALAVDPSTPATLYAGTFGGGVFKSLNGGGSWAPANAGLTGLSAYINALAIDPATPATVYAGTDAGVFKTVNGGGSWTPASTGLTTTTCCLYVLALAIDPVTTTTVYAGIDGGGGFKTVNGGDSWTPLNIPQIYPLVSGLAIDPITPMTVYAAGGSVFRSIDGGASWTTLNNGLATLSMRVVALDGTGKNLHGGSDGSGEFDYTLTLSASYFTVAPCRVADTRNPPGPSGGPPLSANTIRSFPVAGICGIPASAAGVAINIAVFAPTDGGDLRSIRRERPLRWPARSTSARSSSGPTTPSSRSASAARSLSSATCRPAAPAAPTSSSTCSGTSSDDHPGDPERERVPARAIRNAADDIPPTAEHDRERSGLGEFARTGLVIPPRAESFFYCRHDAGRCCPNPSRR